LATASKALLTTLWLLIAFEKRGALAPSLSARPDDGTPGLSSFPRSHSQRTVSLPKDEPDTPWVFTSDFVFDFAPSRFPRTGLRAVTPARHDSPGTATTPTKFPVWNNGFLMVRNGYFHSLTKGGTDWRFLLGDELYALLEQDE
jgi:hypothetical protein